MQLSSLSVAEIRRRLLEGWSITPQLLAQMRKDPRRGVQQLGRRLTRERGRQQRERRRIEGMLHFERILWRSGFQIVVGVDEVGVGPLAGPVVAAAVVFPPGTFITGVDDCKRLTPQRRRALDRIIRRRAKAIRIGRAEAAEIDELNIHQAGLLAMKRAVQGLPNTPDHILVDAREIPDLTIPQSAFTKGDGLNFSIAAASIVAKAYRDRLMVKLDRRYPQYGFARHKGYSTPQHQQAIRRHGPSPAHRQSFTFIRELCGLYSARFYDLKSRLMALESRDQVRALEAEFEEQRERLPAWESRKLRLLLSRRWKSLDGG